MTASRALTLVAALALATACGGGGGGGGGSSGGGITVSPTSLTFTAEAGGELPLGQRVRMGITDRRAVYYGAAWMEGTPTWASVYDQQAGADVDFQVTITTTDLAPGSYTATLRVGIGDADENILGYQDVPVTYVVRNVLHAAPRSLDFVAFEGGSSPAPQALTISGAGIAWSATADQPFIRLDRSSGTAPGALRVSVDPTGLPPGVHDGSVAVTSASGHATVAVRMTVAAEEVVVDREALTFGGINGQALAAQAVSIALNSGAAVAWNATTSDPWIRLGQTAGQTPGTLEIGVDSRGALPSGTYDGTVTVTATAGAATLTRTIAVTLTLARPVLSATPTPIAFSTVNGPPVAATTIAVTADNGVALDWRATAGASWIVLDRTSGTMPTPLAVSVDPSRGPLASGTYRSTVTLTASYAGETLTEVVPVSLVLTPPTLTVSPASIVAGGANGRALAAASFSVALNTGTARFPFAATADASWMVLDGATGSASPAPAVVDVSWDRSALAGGTYQGSIRVATRVNGDDLSATVPVTLRLDDHLLLADDDGVAFASMPGLSSITRTLHLRDNFGATTAWTASADQAWLAVTSSGTTPGDLVLTADPAGLAGDRIHYATVTVRSPDPTVKRAETIRVGFWVGTATPAERTRLTTQFTNVVLDPIRPYAYVHAGGKALTVYDVYSGSVVATAEVGLAGLGEMAVASDGSTLYVTDGKGIVPVRLPDLVAGTPLAPSGTSNVRLAFTRVGGKRLLLTGEGHALDVATGADLGASFSGGYYRNTLLAASLDGTRLAILEPGISPSAFTVYATDYSAVDGGRLIVTTMSSSWDAAGSNGTDLALDATGARLYTACGAPYQFPAFDVSRAGAVTVLPPYPGDSYPNNAEVARDGRLVFGASVWYEPNDVWIYDPVTRQEKWSARLSGYAREILPRQLKISADGLRLVALTDDPAMLLLTVAP